MNISLNCSNNFIYNNSFARSGINAVDDGIDNHWNNSLGGNFWSDYFGIDWNDDGIGDTPHSILGSAESKDFMPIWEDWFKTPLYIFGFIAFGVVGITMVVFFEKRKVKRREIVYLVIFLIVLLLISLGGIP